MASSTETICEAGTGGGAAKPCDGPAFFEHHGRWPRAAFRSLGGPIGIANVASQMQAIGRLRYELYVARDGKQYEFANPQSGLLLEPVDALSLNFCAIRGGCLLTAVRLTWARDALNDPHLAPIAQAVSRDRLRETVVSSRLVVRPEQGAQAMIVPLFRQVCRSGRVSGARYSLLATRHELTRMFERFGFRKTGVSIDDPVAGALHVLMLDACDLRHLQSVRSPLLSDTRMPECNPAP